MKENVIIVNCNVPSEAFQILSKLRQDFDNDSFEILHAAVVKKEAGQLSVEDGFISGNSVEGHGLTGGLIGALVGVLGGPLGVLLGAGVGELIGDSMDANKVENNTELLEKASECLTDGETALMLLVKEDDETALPSMLKDFQISITRMGAKEIEAEIEQAEKQKAKEEEIRKAAAARTEG